MTSPSNPHHDPRVDPPAEPAEASDATEEVDPNEPPTGDADGPHGTAIVEPPEEAVTRLAAELEEVRDRHLRLAADFDNFRKRVAKERIETWARAQADVVAKLLDSIDDLARVASVELEQAKAADVLTGVALVEKKLLKELETAGLEKIGTAGEPFDPHQHEAISTVPAQKKKHDHTVADVVQPGYRFGGALLRPARVRVYTWISGD